MSWQDYRTLVTSIDASLILEGLGVALAIALDVPEACGLDGSTDSTLSP